MDTYVDRHGKVSSSIVAVIQMEGAQRVRNVGDTVQVPEIDVISLGSCNLFQVYGNS